MESENTATPSWLDRSLATVTPRLTLEMLLVIVILILTVVSRFYGIDHRVMAHDEVNHVVPAFDLYSGRGYSYDPVTHGPLQFHLLAFSFFLLGDSDLSARMPAALFSIATVAVVLFAFRRYLGRTGALIAGFLFLVSPYMLFYGRYTRNEVFIVLWGVLTIYSVLRYLEKGDKFSLYLLTITSALHFTDKATAFIFTAQILIFLAFVFVDRMLRHRWPTDGARTLFLVYVFVALLLLFGALGGAVWSASQPVPVTPTPAPEGVQGPLPSPTSAEAAPALFSTFGTVEIVLLIVLAAAAVVGVMAIVTLIANLGVRMIRTDRAFDMIVVLFTLVMPQLSPIVVKLMRANPLDYSPEGMWRTGLVIGVLALAAIVIGIWWRGGLWIKQAVIFYAIFIVLYSTFFTNGRGVFMGLVGSLGYWMSQQGVERGSQPYYYYALIQIPIYEYLAALGALLALYLGIRHNRLAQAPNLAPAYEPLPIPEQPEEPNLQERVEADSVNGEMPVEQPYGNRLPVLILLLYWSLFSLVSFSVAGEKMPWLTTHIAMPMLLASGWALGYVVDTTPWKKLANPEGLGTILLLPVFFASAAGFMGSVLGATPPFAGNTLEQLQATSAFLISALGMAGSAAGLLYLLRSWTAGNILRLLTLTFFGVLAVLTARTAYKAAYINQDNATEFLVYAHAPYGPKEILAQVEEISRRTTRGLDIEVAYDNDSLYPYWWYMRHYPNHRWFTDKPTRDLRTAPIIVAGEGNYAKLEPIVRNEYIQYEYLRMVWPMQDYWDLTWERVSNAFSDPRMREALWDIWLNRDYKLYAEVTGKKDLTLEDWQPSNRFRLYIRKDVLAQMWNYGAAPAASSEVEADPYEKKMLALAPDRMVVPLDTSGMFQAPRGVAVAADGSLYVADSRNHRIVHLNAQGEVLHTWGTFGQTVESQPAPPGGQFNEPWGVAVAPDGSVYVTDTWNHRVQKFSAEGNFLTMWGRFGQAETPDAFWGPRGIAVDKDGRVYVADTGNKRIAIFNGNGEFVTQFGSVGMDPGQFDEPVGVAVSATGWVYVADTWNQRIQAFAPTEDALSFLPIKQWEVSAWIGQSLENKPFISVDAQSNVYIPDPEGLRILQFDSEGQFVRGWGLATEGFEGLGIVNGVAADPAGGVWVSDSENNRLLHFSLPQ